MIFWNVSMIWHQNFSVNSMWALQHMALLHLMVRCSGKTCPCVDDLAIAASWFSIAMWHSQKVNFVFSGDGGVILPGKMWWFCLVSLVQNGCIWGTKGFLGRLTLGYKPQGRAPKSWLKCHEFLGQPWRHVLDFLRFFKENRGFPWDFHRFYMILPITIWDHLGKPTSDGTVGSFVRPSPSFCPGQVRSRSRCGGLWPGHGARIFRSGTVRVGWLLILPYLNIQKIIMTCYNVP